MENNAPNNQLAVLSLIFGLVTILLVCAGMVPFPLTGFLCFPPALVFGILALAFGLAGLAQIRKRNEPGKPMAWAGIIIGGLVFLCALCVALSFSALFLFAPQYVPTPPPFPGGYQF